ncbi:MAG: SMP-30/gluconolactonase/LRE family protein [Marinisporobacter sp.]|jgi:sugar lactone lactonase YvrE|nr:SMP-30/gluconolactonase/LRE family protein [Marinisporobacter sp.]
MKPKAELIYPAKSLLGEGPYWDEALKKLVWVDIEGCSINLLDPRKKENEKIDIHKRIGCIVPREKGGAVIALEDGLYFFDYQTKEVNFIDDPEKHILANRFNDGKCDSAGRLWVGTMAKNQQDEKAYGAGNLYRMDKNLQIKRMIKDVTISNGIGWSPNNKEMYYVDTITHQLVTYEYDLKNGEISNPKTTICISEEDGVPDGICVDAQGMIWIAHWGGAKVSRWNPKDGKCIEQYEIPTPLVTSCAFGGENYNELFITTASVGLEENIYAGGIYRIKLKYVNGLPVCSFKG